MTFTQQGSERLLDKRSNILSLTKLDSTITYVNGEFESISGFQSGELLGQYHNVIRHEDMPKVAFTDMWQHLEAGQSWMGVVKNRCKDGSYYWVDAYASPIQHNGEAIEYQSVRRAPDPDVKARAETLYNTLKGASHPERKLPRSPKLSFVQKQLLMTLIVFLGAMAVAVCLPLLQAVTIDAVLLAALMVFTGWNLYAISQAVELAKQVSSSPLAAYVYTGRTDEAGMIRLALTRLRGETAAVLGRITNFSHMLRAKQTDVCRNVRAGEDALNGLSTDFKTIEQATDEMVAAVEQVTEGAHEGTRITQQAADAMSEGQAAISAARVSMDSVRAHITEANQELAKLKSDSEAISSVVEVIQEVAEQTNLLALNAAIEAARAGEQGRGFAVVADEVRSLATRTYQSTEAIISAIERVQSGSSNAYSKMELAVGAVEHSHQQSIQVDASVTKVHQGLEQIHTNALETAAAMTQQNESVQQINQRVANAVTVTTSIVQVCGENSQACEEMSDLSDKMQSLASQFWTQVTVPKS